AEVSQPVTPNRLGGAPTPPTPKNSSRPTNGSAERRTISPFPLPDGPAIRTIRRAGTGRGGGGVTDGDSRPAGATARLRLPRSPHDDARQHTARRTHRPHPPQTPIHPDRRQRTATQRRASREPSTGPPPRLRLPRSPHDDSRPHTARRTHRPHPPQTRLHPDRRHRTAA